jgi:Zn-dependent peptidase ImmA (M78 family)
LPIASDPASDRPLIGSGPGPGSTRVGTMPRAEAAAVRVRTDFGLADDTLVDVGEIANQLGAEIVYEGLGADVSGMLVREQDRVVIGVNLSHPDTRRRFTIAHEIGHLVLHRGRPLLVDPVRINLRDSRSSLATDLEEIEANSFAAELLMPKSLVLRNFRELADGGVQSLDRIKQDLAHGFGVSEQAMEYRLANLGLLRST